MGEVKVICDILNQAKINSLDSVRRERVSADDASGPQSDYLNEVSTTNDLAVLTPYEITFRSFSAELAAVLSHFAASPYGLLVKSLNVEPAPAAAAADPSALASVAPVAPVYTPLPTASRRAEGPEAFASRYGRLANPGGPAVPPRAAAPVPVYAAPVAAAPVKSGLQTMLNEKQLKVTMVVEVIKLLPPK